MSRMTASTPASSPAKGENSLTVILAFGANFLIAIAKTVVAFLTGSAAMVAEAAHSWADTGNEVFLLVGERRAQRAADVSHPLGYGRSGYVWSMFAAFGLFAVGSAVSVWHGIQSLNAPEEETSYLWAYIVLAVAFVLEGASFLQAFGEARTKAAERDESILAHVKYTSNPMLRSVFVEDSLALIGLIIAALGLFLHQQTGDPVWDAVASILVGVVLGVGAIVLISRNAHFLTGEATSERGRNHLLGLILGHPNVESVSFLHTQWIGADSVLVIATVDLVGDVPESRLQVLLQQVEDEVEKVPEISRAILGLTNPRNTDRLTVAEG